MAIIDNVPTDNATSETNEPRIKKGTDPQIVVQGHLKSGENSDIIVFSIPLALFEIVCIVTIPSEGETRAPVYCKFKVNRRERS